MMRVPGSRLALSFRLLAFGCWLSAVEGQALAQSSSASPQHTVVEFSEVEIKRILQHELGPVPADPTNKYADDPAAAHLGQFLFFDTRLSSNGQVSCATCHDPQQGFADSKPLGVGISELTRHSMTIWNTAYNRWFFWDGRADSQWSQALGPLENELEHGGNRMRIARLLFDDPELRRAYVNVFGPMPDLSDEERFPTDARPVEGQPDHPHQRAWDSMTQADRDAVNRVFANVGKAIAAYERKIVSRGSPFDVFLDGLKTNDAQKLAALSPAAQRGLKLFIGPANCRLCHAGPNFTDGEFHNTGVPPLAGKALPPDAGRHAGAAKLLASPFNGAGPYSDDPHGVGGDKVRFLVNSPERWGEFKTPGLRNVAQTAPYMHQGQFATLAQVIHFYSTLEGAVAIGHHQETTLTPLQLTDAEAADLLAFLESLTGQPVDESLLSQPEAPYPAQELDVEN